MSAIRDTYTRRHARSAALFEAAQAALPDGLTHDGRAADPFPLYVERSSGAHKWDADGNQFIDYWTGHGSLMLGHGHPSVVAAVQQQMERGTHYGAEHAAILRWTELVQQCFPGIETLRFTASGTEATMMAVRLARAFTGRDAVVRFLGHYHGWHDTLVHGMDGNTTPPPGVPRALTDVTIALPPDLDQVEAALQRENVAALILEPTGASYGMQPLSIETLRALRALTARYGTLLIADEIVTGFRLAPGGAQQRAGLCADLTTLAKVLAGGLAGGAVGGRADVMRLLSFGSDRKLRHNGTFNANPLSAAAGIATLEEIATGGPSEAANTAGEQLVGGMNGVLSQRGLRGWAAYGEGSIFHVLAGGDTQIAPGTPPTGLALDELKRGGDGRTIGLLRMALVNHGVDLMRGRSGFLSIAHTPDVIDATVAAFASAVDDVLAEV